MRRQGGINNAALFGASQRSARNKLETMGGIQRNPRGILASSSALMQAAAPRAMTPPPPMMQQASMPMVQPALPQVPMQTTVAPMVQQAPVQQQAPAQQQQASMNPMQQDAVKLQEGGKIDVTQSPTAAPMTRFQLAMFGLGSDIYEKVLGKYGSEKKAEEEAVKKRDKIKKVASETDDSVTIANEVMRASEVEPTDDNKKDFAENVFGLTDVNDIDEINDRIAKVAINSTIGGGTQGTDKFARAVLLGLQNYKQTAAARASGGAGASSAAFRSPINAYQDARKAVIEMAINDRRLQRNLEDRGISLEDYAEKQAEDLLIKSYTPEILIRNGFGRLVQNTTDDTAPPPAPSDTQENTTETEKTPAENEIDRLLEKYPVGGG
tara:strand:+ start:1128 stop:2270 length:1143 start_codon:yes stop_codon:yes gene_type:complete